MKLEETKTKVEKELRFLGQNYMYIADRIASSNSIDTLSDREDFIEEIQSMNKNITNIIKLLK